MLVRSTRSSRTLDVLTPRGVRSEVTEESGYSSKGTVSPGRKKVRHPSGDSVSHRSVVRSGSHKNPYRDRLFTETSLPTPSLRHPSPVSESCGLRSTGRLTTKTFRSVNSGDTPRLEERVGTYPLPVLPGTQGPDVTLLRRTASSIVVGGTGTTAGSSSLPPPLGGSTIPDLYRALGRKGERQLLRRSATPQGSEVVRGKKTGVSE